MNTEHKDIKQILPYGEQLRGFANQKFLSTSELNRILKERGVFSLFNEKDYMVPLLQTLLLSPKEFDKIRDTFATKEDNKKVISRDITWKDGIQLFSTDMVAMEVTEFIKQKLPTCNLVNPIILVPVENNHNHLKAEFTLERQDINKVWYEQTNIFNGAIEFINENKGKGRVIISHTAIETKELAEFVVKTQIREFKKKGLLPENEQIRKITFNEFSNEERFVFFFRLTNHLQCDYFSCQNIKEVSIKPEDNPLPEEIKWMEEINKILLSGKSLDKKYFIEDKKFHRHLIIWNLDASFTYNYKGQKGECLVNFGFPDYTTDNYIDPEFELNISSISPSDNIDLKDRKSLKSQLLYEMDKQKSIVHNNFIFI